MFKNITKSEILQLQSEVTYIERQVASKTIVQNKHLSITLFAFDQGEGLSSHSASGEAFVLVLDGEVEITIDNKQYTLKAGDSIVMPANVPHALDARLKFKMLLVVVQPSQ